MYLQELKDYLNENLHVDKVYINEDGGWLFYPHPSFRNEVLRSEILKEVEVAETTPSETDKKESAKSKKELKQN